MQQRLERITELTEHLELAIGELWETYGDHPSIRRLSNSVERLLIDLSELHARCGELVPPQRTRPELVLVPDDPYEPHFWKDADDEGVGGFRY